MSKGQKRNSREAKKPKAVKPVVLATSNLKSLGATIATPSGKKKK